MKISFYQAFVFFTLFAGCNYPDKKNSTMDFDAPFNYKLIKDWPRLPAGFTLGNPTGIGIDTSQNIFVFHRVTRTWPITDRMPKSVIPQKTILMLDRKTGKILKSWGDSIFIMPHGLTVDKDNNVWVTDVGLQQVFKFSHEGKLLMKIGEARTPGDDSAHFNRPTDIAIADDGSFYVSDGYLNSRVVKFSASGKYLFEWGTKGSKAGEFDLPHSICLDDKGNVYVADRENSRVQVFDANGKFLKDWSNDHFGNIYAVTFDTIKKQLIAIDYTSKGSDVIIFYTNGKILFQFGRTGYYNGPVCRYHDVITDNKGNIYVGDILGNRIRKFTEF